MKEDTYICNSFPVGNVKPVSVNGDRLMTLLEGYNAKLLDVRIDDVTMPIRRNRRLQPVVDGELILYKEQLRLHHQIRPITVREIEDGEYELVEGEVQVAALVELEYSHATAIVIECTDDEKVQQISSLLMSTQTEIPYSIRLAVFDEVKQAVKNGRKELKNSECCDLPTTNEMLSEVLGTSESYTKLLGKFSESDNVKQIGKRLDAGESFNSVASSPESKSGKIKDVLPPQEPSKIKKDDSHDIKRICPECPNYVKFKESLLAMRNSATNSNTKEK